MPFPNLNKWGIIGSPLIHSPFNAEVETNNSSPPPSDYFLLLNGGNFLLLNGENFLLL